jgi:hypothetical protein
MQGDTQGTQQVSERSGWAAVGRHLPDDGGGAY